MVRDVLPRDECDRVLGALRVVEQAWRGECVRRGHKDLASVSAVPGPHGLVQCLQLPALWIVRQHPRVVQVFADLWKVAPEDLLCSFDGYRLIVRGRVLKPNTFWMHTDSSAENAKLECVQGSVALDSSRDERDGDLVVWQHGHRAHAGYFAELKPTLADSAKAMAALKENWHKFPLDFANAIEQDGSRYLAAGDPHLVENGGRGGPLPMPRVRVCRFPGDVVLWYSTTPHQSQVPAAGAPHDACAAFVCMMPRAMAKSKDELKKRKVIYEDPDGRVTSHWPVRFVKQFPKKPRLYSAEAIQLYQDCVKHVRPLIRAQVEMEGVGLSALGRRLVGYEQ